MKPKKCPYGCGDGQCLICYPPFDLKQYLDEQDEQAEQHEKRGE